MWSRGPILALCVVGACPAQAGTVYQSIANLGSAPTGLYFSGPADGGEIGEQIRLGQADLISSLTFAVSTQIALPQNISVAYYYDVPVPDAGHATGAVAFEESFTPANWTVQSTGKGSDLITVDPTGLRLQANTTYDMVLFNKNNVPLLLDTYNRTVGGSLDSFSLTLSNNGWFGATNGNDLAIEMNGQPVDVPEPSPLLLLGLGVAGLVLARRLGGAPARA